jgi:hypothetical protein
VALQAHPYLTYTKQTRDRISNNYRYVQDWCGTEPETKQRAAGKIESLKSSFGFVERRGFFLGQENKVVRPPWFSRKKEH